MSKVDDLQHCASCGAAIEVVTQYLSNGDEVKLVRCPREGLYAVVGMDGKIAFPDQHSEHELGVTSTKLDNGDRVEMQSCTECGFYAIGGGARELIANV